MFEYFSLLNRIEWTVLFITFFISSRFPNVRWLIGTVIVLKTIDVLTIEVILQWGGFYYIAISLLDFFVILSILFRQKSAGYIASIGVPWLSQLAHGSAQYYKLTSNEISLVILYFISIGINLASFFERLVRKYSEFEPMFIYNSYPTAKFVLTALSVLVFCSLAINSANNIYQNRKAH